MDFREENKQENSRLRSVANRLTAQQWSLDLGGGWTVGTMLCHVAFWDKMTAIRLQRWIATDRLAAVPDQDNVDSINDSVRSLAGQIRFEEGAKFVLMCADEIDLLVAELPATRLEALEKSGRDRWVKRSLHRQIHLARIEKALDSSR